MIPKWRAYVTPGRSFPPLARSTACSLRTPSPYHLPSTTHAGHLPSTTHAGHPILVNQARCSSFHYTQSRSTDRSTSPRHRLTATHSTQPPSRHQSQTHRRTSRPRREDSHLYSKSSTPHNDFKQPMGGLRKPRPSSQFSYLRPAARRCAGILPSDTTSITEPTAATAISTDLPTTSSSSTGHLALRQRCSRPAGRSSRASRAHAAIRSTRTAERR